MDSRDTAQQQTDSPEQTIALTRRLLARSRATLDGVDKRLSSGRNGETSEPPGRDTAP